MGFDVVDDGVEFVGYGGGGDGILAEPVEGFTCAVHVAFFDEPSGSVWCENEYRSVGDRRTHVSGMKGRPPAKANAGMSWMRIDVRQPQASPDGPVQKVIP